MAFNPSVKWKDVRAPETGNHLPRRVYTMIPDRQNGNPGHKGDRIPCRGQAESLDRTSRYCASETRGNVKTKGQRFLKGRKCSLLFTSILACFAAVALGQVTPVATGLNN